MKPSRLAFHLAPTVFTLAVAEFSQRYRGIAVPRIDLELRTGFNPTLTRTWFGAL